MENTNQWYLLDTRTVAVLASLLISLLGFLFPDTPNSDAFTYIRTAEIFNTQGTGAAIDHYGWAMYPIFIGVLRSILEIEPFAAAYLAQAIIFATLVFGYISLVRELDGSPRVEILAAIIVLSYPHLNEYRVEIIRDTGTWALILIGLWQFIVYQRTSLWRHAGGFYIALLLAVGFRAEALLYLFLIPASLAFSKTVARADGVKRFAVFTGLSLLAVVLLGATASLASLNLTELIGSSFSAYWLIVQDTLLPDPQRVQEVSEVIFGEHAANYSGDYLTLFLLFGMIPILLANLWNGAGGPLVIIMVVAVVLRTWRVSSQHIAPIVAVMLTSLLIMITFLIFTRFLASRYVMMFCLMLALFVPIWIDRILTKALHKDRLTLAHGLFGLLLAYCVIDAYVTFGPDKGYVYDAADWLAENTAPDATVVTNNNTVAYFSGRVEDYDRVVWSLPAERILDAPSGTLFALEQNIMNDRMLQDPNVSDQLERIVNFGEEERRRIVIYRRR